MELWKRGKKTRMVEAEELYVADLICCGFSCCSFHLRKQFLEVLRAKWVAEWDTWGKMPVCFYCRCYQLLLQGHVFPTSGQTQRPVTEPQSVVLWRRPTFPGNKNCYVTCVPNCIFLFPKDYHRHTLQKQLSFLFNILSIFGPAEVLRWYMSL